jgi:hypothetical protein
MFPEVFMRPEIYAKGKPPSRYFCRLMKETSPIRDTRVFPSEPPHVRPGGMTQVNDPNIFAETLYSSDLFNCDDIYVILAVFHIAI